MSAYRSFLVTGRGCILAAELMDTAVATDTNGNSQSLAHHQSAGGELVTGCARVKKTRLP